MRFASPEPQTVQNVLNAAHAPTVETFVNARIDNPAPAWTPVAVERWTFQPGAGTLSIPPHDGPQWIVAEGDGVVVANGGAEHALTPGVGLVIPAGQDAVIRNSGDAEASALRGVAAAGFTTEEYDRADIAKQIALDTEAHEALPPGASQVIFERLTLLSGTTLVFEPTSGQDWLAVSHGTLGLTVLGDGLPLSWETGQEREVRPTVRLPALVPGTRATLRNVGEDRLVLLQLRVTPLAQPAS